MTISIASLVLWAGLAASVPGANGFPEFPELPGFTVVRESQVYTPENLWDLIDGAADLFLEYRFVDLHLARYLRSDSVEIRLEVYRHATPEDAFGMYAAERATDYGFIQVGTQGYRAEGVVNFFCGSLYVKLSTYESSPSMEQALVDLAGRFAVTADQKCAWPAALSLFPSDGKTENSEQFVRKGFLGYSCFPGTYSASYSPGGKIFIVVAADSAEVRRIIHAYGNAVKHPGVPRSGDLLVFEDPHNGHVEMLPAGRYLGGVYDAPHDAVRDSLVRLLRQSLSRTK